MKMIKSLPQCLTSLLLLLVCAVYADNAMACGATGCSGNANMESDPEVPEDDEQKPDESCNATAADPVSLYTGYWFESVIDLTVKGRFPIVMTRKYRAQVFYDSPIGYGWGWNYDNRLFKYADGSLVIRRGCGVRYQFYYTGGAYQAPSNLKSTLKENTNGSFTLTLLSGETEVYDVKGRLTRITQPTGESLVLSYDSRGRLPLTGSTPHSINPAQPMVIAMDYRLTRIEAYAANNSSTGRFVRLYYNDATGRLTRIQDHSGRIVRYHHDTTTSAANGNLTRIEGLAGIETLYGYSDPADPHNVTSLKRGNMAEMTQVYDERGRVISQNQGNRSWLFNYLIPLNYTEVTEIVRDAAGDELRRAKSFHRFNPDSTLRAYTPPVGIQVNYSYDGNKNLLSISGSGDRPGIRSYDAEGNLIALRIQYAADVFDETTWTYDQGRVTSVRALSSALPDNLYYKTIQYEYVNGVPRRIIQESVNMGGDITHVTRYGYDTEGRLISVTLPDQHTLIQEWDGDNLSRRYQRDSNGHVITDGQWFYRYDNRGNVIESEDALGRKTRFDYDALDRVTRSVNAQGEEVVLNYDSDRLSAIEIGRTSSGDGLKRRFVYDSLNQLTQVEEWSGQVWIPIDVRALDSKGNVLQQTNALGQSTLYSYDAAGRLISSTDAAGHTQSYQYEFATGNLSKAIDGNGNVITYTYDKAYRVKDITTATTKAEFSYDVLDNLLSVTDKNGNSTRFSYDGLGRKVTETRPMGEEIRTEYDSHGRIRAVTNARGQRTRYDYLAWGPLVKIRHYSGAQTHDDNLLGTVSASYDKVGNLLTISDDRIQSGPLYTRSYDALNRLTAVQNHYIPGQPSIQYSYTALGNISSLGMTDSSGSVNHQYHYDARGLLSGAVLPGAQFVLTDRDALGRISQHLHANQTVTDYSYTVDGLPYSIATSHHTTGSLQQLGYLNDNAHNITGITSNVGNAAYSYDSDNRIQSADYPELPSGFTHPTNDPWPNNQSFSYDDASNLSIGSRPWTFNANNQLTQGEVNGSTQRFQYDADGNYTGAAGISIPAVTHRYDNDNRRIAFSDGKINPTTSADYRYDPMGRRISKTITTRDGASTTLKQHWYLWEGQSLLAEYDASGQRQKRYAYLPGSYLPEQMADSTGIYTVHSDHLQTPTVLSNSQGTTVWSMQHVAFGQAWINNDPDGDGIAVEFNQRFPGQYYDQETGLNYNYYRDYDPSLGRYIQSDPIGLRGGLNTYAYVGANPVNYIDPYGESATAAVGGWIGTDTAIPDPTDAAWPKWVGYGAALGGAALLDWLIYNNENSNDDGGQCPEGSPDDKKLSNGEIDKLKDAGFDPHDLKPKKGGSKFDLFKDKNGNIIVKPKKGNGPGDPTGLNINDF